jgi:hypothetical protein
MGQSKWLIPWKEGAKKPPKKQKNKKKSPQSDENLKFFTFLGNNYSCSAAIITPPIILQLLKIAHSHAGWLAGWLAIVRKKGSLHLMDLTTTHGHDNM